MGSKPWKIIGATATIQDLLGKPGSYIFAERGSFLHMDPMPTTRSTIVPVRENWAHFCGDFGVGRKHTPAVTKALSIFYRQVQKVRDVIAHDPAKAASIYGVGNLSEPERKDLLFLYELALTYVLTRKGSDQVAEAIESRVRRKLPDSSPQHGELLIEMFNGGIDVSHMISTMDELKTETSEADPGTRTRGIVTTNIIGHGVDVDRFNVIVFAGFTRLVAEYIQASARVGRRFPGISIFVPTPQSERDRHLRSVCQIPSVSRSPRRPGGCDAMAGTGHAADAAGYALRILYGCRLSSLGRPLATVEAIHDAPAIQEPGHWLRMKS